MKKNIDHKTAANLLVTIFTPALLSTNALASGGNIANSPIGQGLKNLLNDLSTYIMVLSPIVAGAAAGYFVMRRSMADEQDGKLWEKRIKTAVVCGVVGALVGGIIKLISSYFG